MNLNPIPWLKTKDNRDAALAVVTITTAILTGGWFAYQQLSKSNSPKAPTGITIDGNNNGIIQQGNDNTASQ